MQDMILIIVFSIAIHIYTIETKKLLKIQKGEVKVSGHTDNHGSDGLIPSILYQEPDRTYVHIWPRNLSSNNYELVQCIYWLVQRTR